MTVANDRTELIWEIIVRSYEIADDIIKATKEEGKKGHKTGTHPQHWSKQAE
jgi:hypothetical protein